MWLTMKLPNAVASNVVRVAAMAEVVPGQVVKLYVSTLGEADVKKEVATCDR